jgi:hypothetical protein
MDDIQPEDVGLLDDDELCNAYANNEYVLARLASMAVGLHRLHGLLADELTRRVSVEADALVRQLAG